MRRVVRLLARAGTALLVAATVLVHASGRAAADEQFGSWFVAELRGSAFSRLGEAGDGPWRPLQPGESLVAGSIVRTGNDGNLLLANRVDRVRLSPNSELELPGREEGDAITRVIHWIGTAVFDVGKRPSPQFEVSTPYLVAVVKGTSFATTVSEAGSVIKVTEGIVGVASVQGGASVDVTAGETASVSASDSGTVSPGDLPAASAPEQGGAAAAPSTAATAIAGGATVESDTVAGAGGGATAQGADGPGGGDGGGGNRDGTRRSQSIRDPGDGGTGGQGDNDDDDGDDDDDDDDGDDDDDDDDHDHGGWHGHGCHGDGGCHHGGWHHRG
jgi:hypothetical protein